MDPFDCELLREGWLAQPVNSLSAFAFVVVGALLWRRGRSAIGWIAIATGFGSVWFHARPSAAAEWAHDISLYALVAAAAIEVWRRLRSGRFPILATVIFVAGIVAWWMGRTGSPLCDPGSLIQWHAVWHAASAAALWMLVVSPGD